MPFLLPSFTKITCSIGTHDATNIMNQFTHSWGYLMRLRKRSRERKDEFLTLVERATILLGILSFAVPVSPSAPSGARAST